MYNIEKDEDLDLLLNDEEFRSVFKTAEVCEKTSRTDSQDPLDKGENNSGEDDKKNIHYERKFPGPAGLVRKQLSVFVKDESGNDQNNSVNYSQVCSQRSTITFDSDSWQKLLQDVYENGLNDVLNQWTVSFVKHTLIGSRTTRKIPLFAGVIRFIDCSLNDPSVIFKDPSGEMRGTLHRDVWEEFNEYLMVGSSLLLQQVGVIMLQNSRKLYLNITKNNIITIYNSSPDGAPSLHVIKLLPIPSAETVSRNLAQLQVKNELCEEPSDSSNTNKRSEGGCSIMSKKSKLSANIQKKLGGFKSTIKEIEQLEKLDRVEMKSTDSGHVKVDDKDIVLSTLEGIDVDHIFSEEF